MNSAEYWRKRSEQVAKRQFDKADLYEAELRREYGRAIRSINRDIEVFYRRYAINNEISMAEAKKALTGKELKEFKMTLEEFTAKAKNNADGTWTKDLNNIYFRTRISRFEALKVQIRHQVETLAGSRQRGARTLLGGIYEDTYYRTLFEIQRGTGIGASFARVNDKGLETILSTELAGSNWSKRIWGDRDKLIAELQTKLSQSFIRGDSVEKTTKDVTERMNVSRSNAERLVQTESSFFTHEATAAGYKASGMIDRYEILATLDGKTSPICRSMDGKVFKLAEKEVNVNYPPFHVRCRTTVVPYFDDEVDAGERIAKDPDGKTYHVPGDMKYPEWKKEYVDSQNAPESAIIDEISFRKFTTVSEVKQWESEVTPGWISSLTSREKTAIERYTGSAYSDINRMLRNGEQNDYLTELANNISTGLAKFDLKDNILLHRGISRNIFGKPASELVDSIYVEHGFVSTSVLESGGFSGAVKMEIRAPAGTVGAFINPLSDYEDTEFEFLLDKGTKFEILDAQEENGVLYLIMEVLKDD